MLSLHFGILGSWEAADGGASFRTVYVWGPACRYWDRRTSGRAPGSEPECIGGNGIAGDCCCLLLTGRDTRGGDAADGGAAVGCPRGRAPAASAPVAFGTGLAPTALIVGVGRAAASWGLCACVFLGLGANAPTGVCAGAAKPDPRAGAWGMGRPDGASPGSNAGVAEAAAPAATTGARGRSPTAVGRRVAEGRISAASSRPPCCFFSRCMIEWP